MNTDITYNVIDISDPTESFQSKQSQLDPIDYNLLINKPESFLMYYSKGDGSDGDLVVSGIETVYRDMYYNNLTVPVSCTLYTNGYSICVKGTLINEGTIAHNGNNGNSASGVTGGNGGAAANQGTLGINYGGKKGGNGGDYSVTNIPHQNGVVGDSSNPSYSSTNAVNGASGGNTSGSLLNNGGLGGTATRGINYNVYLNIAQALAQLSMPTRNYNVLYNGLPSSGGSGGGEHQGYLTTGGGAGGSGSNGGIIVIHCGMYYGAGTIQAKGGIGGNGTSGTNLGGGAGGGGGGGGSGGSGGIIFFTYTGGVAPTTDVTGGNGGTGGASIGFGGAGANGNTGASGATIIINK